MKGLNLQEMMKQAKYLQETLAKRQEELAKKAFEASSGGGMVTAVVSGKMELVGLKIDPAVVDKKEIGMLEDLVVASVNSALHEAHEAAQGLMSGLVGGMPDLGQLSG